MVGHDLLLDVVGTHLHDLLEQMDWSAGDESLQYFHAFLLEVIELGLLGLEGRVFAAHRLALLLFVFGRGLAVQRGLFLGATHLKGIIYIG